MKYGNDQSIIIEKKSDERLGRCMLELRGDESSSVTKSDKVQTSVSLHRVQCNGYSGLALGPIHFSFCVLSPT